MYTTFRNKSTYCNLWNLMTAVKGRCFASSAVGIFRVTEYTARSRCHETPHRPHMQVFPRFIHANI